MIQFKGVQKVYPTGVTALYDVNMRINKGEFVFVLGPSGAGKSTFLKLMLREEAATAGEILVNGYNLSTIKNKDIPYMRRGLGVVFQDFRLIDSMTAYENVAFAMRVTNIPEKEIEKRVPYVLSLVGLGEQLHSYPQELSGGQQQRVSLARALVHAPPIIIADEPTGNIDPELSLEIMELLCAINSIGTTVVVVTHEEELAQQFKKRVIRIERGRVVQDIPQGASRAYTAPARADAHAAKAATAARKVVQNTGDAPQENAEIASEIAASVSAAVAQQAQEMHAQHAAKQQAQPAEPQNTPEMNTPQPEPAQPAQEVPAPKNAQDVDGILAQLAAARAAKGEPPKTNGEGGAQGG